jgi:hypothetical protein
MTLNFTFGILPKICRHIPVFGQNFTKIKDISNEDLRTRIISRHDSYL